VVFLDWTNFKLKIVKKVNLGLPILSYAFGHAFFAIGFKVF